MIEPAKFKPAADPRGGGYVYSEALQRAIRVALVTERPLLLRGTPGTGKTTLARDLAGHLVGGADFYAEVVTSRTEARDLQWRFDAILRLADTQIDDASKKRVARPANYVEPRALWWAFDPDTAATRGGNADSNAADPLGEPGSSVARPAVVLIDEIDKAEPEVANDLLEPFDTKSFRVAETGTAVTRKRDVFVVVTTNEERDLPQAFLRRCVVHELDLPDDDQLKKIAQSHFATKLEDPSIAKMIGQYRTLVDEAVRKRLREPGTAEFIDAVRATRALKPEDGEWEAITRIAMWKHTSKERSR